MRDDVKVVVRSVGERTERACRDILVRQVPEENIVIIHEVPFSEAVRKTFSIGIQENLMWTLAVDADVLLTPNAVDSMIKTAKQKPEHTFVYQGCVLDKLFKDIRPGGPHLYRTALLPRAVGFISDNDLRPESHSYAKMAEIGFHFYQEPEIYGLHDYEQHTSDIYRKSFLHAKKHSHLTEHFMKEWARSSDPDHAVAISGFLKGLSYDGPVVIDHNFFLKVMGNVSAEFVEKGLPVQVSPSFVADTISAFLEIRPDSVVLKDRFRKSTSRERKNLIPKVLWYAGKRIEELGRIIKQRSSIDIR
jgi:hypothetical protein